MPGYCEYDTNGNVTEIDQPEGATTKYTYVSGSKYLVETMTDPNNHVTSYSYMSRTKFSSHFLPN